MSTHNYKVLKNYPVQYIVKNPRYWWQTINTTYSEDTTVDVELRPFEGLEYTFNNPLITFPRQTLLDGTILDERTYILGESGQEYEYEGAIYKGCLEGEARTSEYDYTALVKDGEVLLVDYDQLRTGYTWANTVTISGDDYFAPIE